MGLTVAVTVRVASRDIFSAPPGLSGVELIEAAREAESARVALRGERGEGG